MMPPVLVGYNPILAFKFDTTSPGSHVPEMQATSSPEWMPWLIQAVADQASKADKARARVRALSIDLS
jgi:hypothetical protein